MGLIKANLIVIVIINTETISNMFKGISPGWAGPTNCANK